MKDEKDGCSEYLMAQIIAESAHNGQFRRDGQTPYIVHPKKVVKTACKLFGHCFKLRSVAILHDVIEDSDQTTQSLIDQGISFEVVEAVDLLTKKDVEGYHEYIYDIKKNELARKVKISDMLSNLSDDPNIKQVKKYSVSLAILLGEI